MIEEGYYSRRLSWAMRRVLSALRDGRTCAPGDRPKRITIKTLEALERRGLVKPDGRHGWLLTPQGYDYAE